MLAGDFQNRARRAFQLFYANFAELRLCVGDGEARADVRRLAVKSIDNLARSSIKSRITSSIGRPAKLAISRNDISTRT